MWLLRPVRTRAQVLWHTVSGQSRLMCVYKSQRVPQQISCADTCAQLLVERRQHEISKDLSIVALACVQSGRVAGPSMNVQWTNDRVLKLIEVYHGNECQMNLKVMANLVSGSTEYRLSSFW
jgi:hypothetical protein